MAPRARRRLGPGQAGQGGEGGRQRLALVLTVEAIRDLTPRQRAIVVLFYLEDRPMDEVADLVGCSTATGYVQLHQARHRLAELLSEEVDGDVR